MQISPEDALAALDAVEDSQIRLKKAIAEGYTSALLILWGMIWALGFMALHFLGGPRGGLVFTILDCFGITGTVYFMRYSPHRTTLRRKQQNTLHTYIWGFWIALILYGTLWGFVLKPASSLELGLYLGTLSMFAYVVMGLWFKSGFMIWLGFGVTALSMVFYYGLPTFFYLGMGIMGGGCLIGTGLIIRKSWR